MPRVPAAVERWRSQKRPRSPASPAFACTLLPPPACRRSLARALDPPQMLRAPLGTAPPLGQRGTCKRPHLCRVGALPRTRQAALAQSGLSRSAAATLGLELRPSRREWPLGQSGLSSIALLASSSALVNWPSLAYAADRLEYSTWWEEGQSEAGAWRTQEDGRGMVMPGSSDPP